MKKSSRRSLKINIIFAIFALIGVLLIPSIFAVYIQKINFIKSDMLCSIIGSLIYIAILVLIYFKDLLEEFKIYKKDFKENISIGFKYYIVGLFVMIIGNLIIGMVINDVSANENSVRELLFSAPVLTMISIMFIAPISEELSFRKSLMPVFKNKWVYATISGLLFGGAHLLAGDLALINLLYLIPYGSLGFVFALMNEKTKTTFTSMTMHAMHNTVTGILLLITYFSGVLQ